MSKMEECPIKSIEALITDSGFNMWRFFMTFRFD
ncbi:predicted protein [Botrytis cinerea T4]|uniref:Uncharacterized protein n=1 Tax=Botryotinia fuckeliana (strain T4) TaxID=999810 RepID=G2Y2W2_BOTF4|nr:predicted protein [Botrytis cinerea T4]